MDLRVHGIDPAVIRRAAARAKAAGETLSDVVRRLLAHYAADYQRQGGEARAEALTPERRTAIAQRAAQARWQRRQEASDD